ncbi:MAG: alpha/beta hydrolase-fold protein, partial [Myxococcales bacterium]
MVISSRSRVRSAWLISAAGALGSIVSGLSACTTDGATPDTGTAGTASGGASAGTSAVAVGGGAGTGSGTNVGGAGGPTAGTGSDAGGAAAGSATAGSAAMGGSSGSGGAAAGSGGAPDVSPEGDGDITAGPTYTTDPNLTDRGKPKGQKFTFSMKLADSKIFKGDDATLTKPAATSRGITVYVPAQYKDGTEAPILVIQDGPGPIDRISRALDNLTVETDPLKKLPPFVAIAVANGGDDSIGSERGLEYDTMSDRYSRFVDTEVLPAVIADPKVHAAYPGLKFTTNPEGRGAFGCSSGGAAALAMGWFTPDKWRRIITYSGTFVDQQNHAQTAEVALFPFGAWEYHSDKELIKNTDNKPLRIFLNANENDNGSTAPESGHHNWLMANQRTAAALKAKNYHYRFVYGQGLGHCDSKVQDQT